MSSKMNILLKDINNESNQSKSTSSNSQTTLNNNSSNSNKLVEKSINNSSNTISNNEPETYCICKRTFDNEDDDMMIECDVCKNWFHGKCVGMNQRLAADIEIYVCPGCLSDEKQIIYKKRYNNHRHDYTDPNAQKKPVQAGTAAFCEQLLKRQFPDAREHGLVCIINHGSELTVDYIEKHGLKRPILIEKKDGLKLTAPSASEINLSKIEDIVGADYLLDVIDVERQEVFQMSINELTTYFRTTPRTKVYNLISFEISKTELTKNISAPGIVSELSWASNGIWPLSDSDDEKQSNNQNNNNNNNKNYITKPEVHKYCLISAANSYTDFHIDFGGSTVWYHTLKGDKIFYLIEPTEENLNIYEKWSLSKNHSEVFLGDKVKNCYKFEIKEGSTIFLPTGWIHAVYTPQDSLVFGGNFLQSYNIPLQLKIYEMELRLKTPEKYRFPAFETLQWYAARYYTQMMKNLNADRKCIKLSLFHGLKHLKDTLKRWLNSKDYYELHDYQVPQRINSEKLVNVMNRELAKQEALLKSSGAYASENSLKLKFKINPTSGQVINATNQIIEEKPKKETSKPQQQKEVLVFNQANITGIKIEDTLPPSESEAPKPLKLKLKLNSDVYSVSQTINDTSSLPPPPPLESQPSKSESIKSDLEYESDTANHEDDEIINDLKNSYQDDDFIYPSLNIGTTARTAAKKNQNQTQPTSSNETSEKTARKRKLKPHAAQYLQPKTETKTTESEPPKKPIDLLIEKNLNETTAVAIKKEESTNDTNDADYEENDDDLEDEDDDDYDYAQDFKAKCQQNLKLSKKLKKNSVKQQKDLQNDETKPTKTKTNGLTPSAIGSSSITSKARPNQPKKFKKGFATSKQRLGKLLKINRIVNI